MSLPILATKLYIPPLRPNAVLRLRLIERLNTGLHRKLTLISAPAGFGKTTLLSEWVSACQRPIAWLSLDQGDSDPVRFLAYLVAALQTIAPTIGAGVMELLQSAQPPPAQSILTALLNEMTTLPDTYLLVLDDYHVLEAKPVDDALIFLLEHVPPQLHLVIATREDPGLPLARLRAQGQLTELRATDLRFTASEAAAFLTEVMGLDLAVADIAALEERTEGWIAGLQLAALSMQGRADIPGFIQAFAGDNRYIVDYLVDEVLQRQPERVRSFLLQTSMLDRLHGPLCDAVTGQVDGKARLEALERGNFFVVPLDDRRTWYRYHHLFAEVLSAHLQAEQPNLVATLHRRASTWYERHGSLADAIRHALAAGDFELAATLVERAVPAMSRSRQQAVLLGWLKALPDEMLHVRPVLSVAYAHMSLDSGELTGVEDLLRHAERWLDTAAAIRAQPQRGSGKGNADMSAEMVVVDDEAFRRLPGAIAVARAGQALARGDVPATIHHARRVLDVALEDDHLSRGAGAAFVGLACWASGDLEAAHRMYAEGMAHLRMAGNISDAINGTITLADIRIAQGRLRDAMRTYELGLGLATAQQWRRRPEGNAQRTPRSTQSVPGTLGTQPVLQSTADIYVGMSELQREHNDLHAATQYLLSSMELGEHSGFPQNQYRRCVAMARLREVEGDLQGALDLLDEAERLYMNAFSPNVRPVAALKTRVWLAQGRLAEALDWAHKQSLSAQDDLDYPREFEHITLARLLLARYTSERADHVMLEAQGLLDRLLQAAEQGERTGSLIEILIVQALAHQMQGDIPAALVPLCRALRLAEPEGYVRIFADEGPAMTTMLLEVVARGRMTDYAGKLVAACGIEQPRSAGTSPLPTSPASPSPVEPLSERELDVLRLFMTELSGPEIAQELMIALSTVRTHTKSIYSKLGVTTRRAAVQRAAELDVI